MERNVKVEAITLKKISMGESNIGVTLLTEKDEVIFVVAFGAAKPKSRLFSGTNPFVTGKWDLYFDPVKEHWRGKEVSVISFNDNLQQRLESFYTATLFAEIVLKSQGSEGIYKLLIPSIEQLQLYSNHKPVLIQFILRYLDQQGILPSFEYCSNCGKFMAKESLFYYGGEEFSCLSCSGGHKLIELTPKMRLYCLKTIYITLEKALKVELDFEVQNNLRELVLILIKKYTSGKLLTLNSANGLI